MRLTKNKIVDILVAVVGEEGLPLIRELIGKENISEFDLASKAKMDIKQVRKMLYLFYNSNMVAFTRKKDKIKGWYIYYWTLMPDNVKFSYMKRKREQLERLRERVQEEGRELFFTCPNKCVRLNFDQSMDFEFHCPECGELVSQDNPEQRLEEYRKTIAQIEQDLEQIRERKKETKRSGKARRKVVKAKVKAKKRK